MAGDPLPYTYCSRKRLKGGWRDYWRFRRDGLDAPLPGDPRANSAALSRYAELMQQADRLAVEKAPPARHTFEWLARQYLASEEFKALAGATQDDYERAIENRLIPALGPERFDCIDRATIKVVRDAVLQEGKAIRTAHKVKQVASLIYSWADEEELLPAGFINPAMRLKKMKGKSKPIEVWSAEEITFYMARCEPHLRTAVLLALYTGQRASDLVAMDWTDFMGNMIRARQNKTGEPLDIPCHPALREHLDAIKTRFGGPIIRAHDGKPTNANALSSALHRSVGRMDGMPMRSLHGLRYASAGNLEAVGCTVVQISAIVGHRTYQMAMQYARQRRDAEAAIAKLERSA